MEATILETAYLGLGTSDQALQVFEDLKQICTKVEGTFNVLWHNTSLKKIEEKNMYRKIIVHI